MVSGEAEKGSVMVCTRVKLLTWSCEVAFGGGEEGGGDEGFGAVV